MTRVPAAIFPRTPLRDPGPCRHFPTDLPRSGLNWKSLRDLLGVDIPLRRRVLQRSRRKGVNGRKGHTKLDLQATGTYLKEHSNETCRLFVGRGKRKAGSEADVRAKRALTDSRHALLRNSSFKQQVSMATWYLKSNFPHYCRCTRKLGVCGKCQQWDESVLPKLRQSLAEWRYKMSAILPEYWSRWDKLIQQEFDEHQVEQVSFHEYLQALRTYVDRSSQHRPAGLSVAVGVQLHQAEASVRHELDSAWSRAAEKVGAVEMVAMHCFHFQMRDAQKTAFQRDWWEPDGDTLYAQLDFKEHDTLPVGPRGPQRILLCECLGLLYPFSQHIP